MFQEHSNTGFEDSSKYCNSFLALQVEEVCSKHNLKHHTLNQHLIDIFKDILHSELLALISCHIIQDCVFFAIECFVSVHQREYAFLLLIKVGWFCLLKERT